MYAPKTPNIWSAVRLRVSVSLAVVTVYLYWGVLVVSVSSVVRVGTLVIAFDYPMRLRAVRRLDDRDIAGTILFADTFVSIVVSDHMSVDRSSMI